MDRPEIPAVRGSGETAVAIIPARFASTRFPGKPLARETGRFLIQHVYERAAAARRVRRVIVATDDARIAAAVRSFGGEAAMTRPDHVSGTDRIAEVVRRLMADGRQRGGAAVDEAGRGGSAPGGLSDPGGIVLNVQGDEPEIEPEHLDRLVQRLGADCECPVATLACPFPHEGDPRDPNCVKVVLDNRNRALYFSRSLIPYARDAGGAPEPGAAQAGQWPGWLLHVGVYGYRRDFLLGLSGWASGPLERLEKLEQLRVLEHGHAIAVEVVERAAIGIDTPEEYARFVARCAGGAAR